jgi:hypothetical protein
MRINRTDRSALTGARRTAAGTMIVPASVSRAGLQEYKLADGSTRVEYRPPQEVFSPASLESLRGAVVTIGHTDDARPAGVGLVSDRDPTRTVRGAEEFVETSLMITDAAASAKVEAKELIEISLGYSADLDLTPGVLPDGRKYDAVQRNVVIHHAALLPAGQARAGREAKIRLDGHEELCADPPPAPGRVEGKSETMAEPITKIKIGDKIFDLGGADHIAHLEGAINSGAAALAGAQAKLDAAVAEAAKEKARADALAAVDVSALVASEITFRDSMRPLLAADYSFEGKPHEAVRADALTAALAAAVRPGAPTYVAQVADAAPAPTLYTRLGSAYADAHKDSK